MSRRRGRRVRPSERGIVALLALLLVGLGVGATIAFSMLPAAVDAEREQSTRARLVELHAATLRFVADVGRLPSGLGELIARGALPVVTTATAQAVPHGWAGPYVAAGFDPAGRLRDLWGRPLRYGAAEGLLAGQLGSAGRDGLFGTGDDLRHPGVATTATSTLTVTLVIWNGVTGLYDTNPSHASDTAQATTATLYHPVEGSETAVPLAVTSTRSPPLVFTGVPRGRHALRLVSSYRGAGVPMSTYVVIETQGNGQQDSAVVRLGGAVMTTSSAVCNGGATCSCPAVSSCALACGTNASSNNCSMSCGSAGACSAAGRNNLTVTGPTSGTSLTASCENNCSVICGGAAMCDVSSIGNNGEVDCGSAGTCDVTCVDACRVTCRGAAPCTVTCTSRPLRSCGGGVWACKSC